MPIMVRRLSWTIAAVGIVIVVATVVFFIRLGWLIH
jgi:hypothetical protein